MRPEDLKRYTGLDEEAFWEHVEGQKKKGLGPHRGNNLSLPAMCLLGLIKIRKNLDMRLVYFTV